MRPSFGGSSHNCERPFKALIVVAAHLRDHKRRVIWPYGSICNVDGHD
jgi:hypothetical protein